jgi:hypothetical protein
MKGSLTKAQRRQFDRDGFLIRPNALSRNEVTELNRVADRLYEEHGGDPRTGRLELRNSVAYHRALLQMVDHPALLPAIVELMGPDIKLRTSELDIRPPRSDAIDGVSPSSGTSTVRFMAIPTWTGCSR